MQLFFPRQALEHVQTWASACELVESEQRPLDVPGFYLWWHDGRLVLYRDRDPRGVSLQPDDFERRATMRGELARACGVTFGHKPRVLDAMAGLGVDGMTLNALGCAVVMIERDPGLWVLLDSFVQIYQAVGGNARVVRADAWNWLQSALHAEAEFDVVFLDPMFPTRSKGALPGKSLQFLAEITEPDRHPLGDWIELARPRAQARVVLKRRLRDPLTGVPDWQIKGRSVRYDVYRGTG